MGLYPDMLPGYAPVGSATKFHEDWVDAIPKDAGLNLLQMVDAAKAGNAEGALRCRLESGFALQHRSVCTVEDFCRGAGHVPDRDGDGCRCDLAGGECLREVRQLHQHCGDLQMLKKAGDLTGTRSDFECIVRIAQAMGYDVRKLVPFGGAGVRADMGQTRGAQSGESDQHAVWLAAHNLESKMSPFDPTAMLDEIQRLVPGYDVSRPGPAGCRRTNIHNWCRLRGRLGVGSRS